MDENTRFLIERMDSHHESLRDELYVLREKIDVLSSFNNKIIGAAMIVSGVVSIVVQYFTGGK